MVDQVSGVRGQGDAGMQGWLNAPQAVTPIPAISLPAPPATRSVALPRMQSQCARSGCLAPLQPIPQSDRCGA